MGTTLILFLDACAIIYRVEGVAPFAERFATLIDQLLPVGQSARLAVSRLSWLECRVKPLRERDVNLLDRYDHFFSAPGLDWVELTPAVVEEACQLRASHKLRTPDALQAASCLVLGSGIPFVTADPTFQRVPGLPVRLLTR